MRVFQIGRLGVDLGLVMAITVGSAILHPVVDIGRVGGLGLLASPGRRGPQVELSRLHLMFEFGSVGLAIIGDVVGAVGKAGLRLVVGFLVAQGEVALLEVEGGFFRLVESHGLGGLLDAGGVPVLVLHLGMREQFAELNGLWLLFVGAAV